jgi:hypothetical protein
VTLQTDLDAIATAVDQVTGLRVQTKQGNAHPPAAVIELDSVTAPSSLGGLADYRVRVLLLVQIGDFRQCLERINTYADPSGTVSTSAFVALLSYAGAVSVSFEAGNVEYGGKTYGGGAFTVEVFA